MKQPSLQEQMNDHLINTEVFDEVRPVLRENKRMRAALESIAGWRKVNISGEYEHGLRDIIRSITDCAAAALEATAVTSQERNPAGEMK